MMGTRVSPCAFVVAVAIAMPVVGVVLHGCSMGSESDNLNPPDERDAISSDSRSEGWTPWEAGADSGAADSFSRGVSDSVAVEAPSEGDAVDADADEAATVDICDEVIAEPQVLYLSADDSNSQASPVIARKLIRQGRLVPSWLVRTYEFLNYYDISYPLPEYRRVTVVSQMRADLDPEGRYALQIGVQGHEMTQETRRPLVLTLVLDTSGSMTGEPIDLEREVVRAIASSLRAGDMVSAVEWDTSRRITLDSHRVSGPDDPVLLSLAASLAAGGGTDLQSGLAMGYDLASRNFRAGALNRVVLVSDGQANVGITDEQLISRHSNDAEREGIYLVGVGCGYGYNDTLMDTVTDEGKGAYIFIDSPAEARKQLVDLFFQNMEIAVMDVRVELTLPPQLRMDEFHGEEYSTIPEEVEPQHLAPNDAMIFHQHLRACPGLADTDVIRAVAEYTDPATRARRSDVFESTIADLLEGGAAQLRKGNAIVVYAETLKKVYRLHRAGRGSEAQDECDEALEAVRAAAAGTGDAELGEIVSLLAAYCADFPSRLDA